MSSPEIASCCLLELEGITRESRYIGPVLVLIIVLSKKISCVEYLMFACKDRSPNIVAHMFTLIVCMLRASWAW